ncbi:MAG: serine hydrolase domain-containing protein [Oceanicaulis sp.]
MIRYFQSAAIGALILAACAPDAQSPGEAAAQPEPAGAEDALMAERLATLPRVRPWPIDWFEPKEMVKGAADPAPLPERDTPLLNEQAWAEATAWAEDNGTAALFVWKDGALDRAWRAADADPGALTNTYYLNYFALVLLVGKAIEDGHIQSVDQPVSTWLTEWDDQPRGAITVRDLLNMASGLELYLDNIDPADKATRVFFGSDTTSAALEYDVEDAPGTRFEYNYINPEILGIVLERASGRRYADYLSEAIWKPVGADEAYVWLDREGGRPHFNAALFARAEDWLRLGVMIAQEGAFGGDQVIPQSWIERMAEPSPANPGYGMVWLAEPYVAERRLADEVPYTVSASEPFAVSDLMIFDGYGGQRLYVSPQEDLVIVRIGQVVRGPAWDDSALPNLIARGLSE